MNQQRLLMRCVLLLCGLAPLQAPAQVSTDEHALDALAAPAKSAAPAPTPAKPVTKAPRKPSAPSVAPVAAPAKPAPRLGPPPPLATAAPANPVIAPPPLVMPAHPAPPPPSVTVHDDAVGTATPITGGTRISFGPNSADLNPATLAALQHIAADALANQATIITITAWAPGTEDDPSTPRRLSLDRALAARAVLIKAGLVSSHIRAVAKGMGTLGKSAPNSADVTETTSSK